MRKVKLVLGTMTFGESVFEEEASKIMEAFLEYGYNSIDTAYTYNKGNSERIIGRILNDVDRDKLEIATKVNPKVTGKLNKKSIINQCNESLSRLKTDYLDVLYLHFPDPNTPIYETLEACDLLFKQGKIKKLGLSNYPAWLVSEAYNICDFNNWILPQVYEGLYNPLSRLAEGELKECLDYHNITFNAYNPLAGGMLTNKYSSKDRDIKSGRFSNRPNYKKRYFIDSFFKASDLVKESCKSYDISVIEASYRWLAYHSMLNPEKGDGIIVGVSKFEHLKDNINSLYKNELPLDIVDAFDRAWDITRVDAPPYYRTVGEM